MKSNNTSDILEKASKFVFSLFKEKLDTQYIYHSYTHTYETVQACEVIGQGSNLSKKELEVVLLAAWFHDTGYIEGWQGHEEVSVTIARGFLEENDYSEKRVEQIIGCIRATKMPQKPQNLLEEILCDADLINLGSKVHFEKSDLLRVEMEMTRNQVMEELEWLQHEIDFLSTHRYHTPFAQLEYNSRKVKNISKLKKTLDALAKSQKRRNIKLKEKAKALKLKKAKAERPERGIETMFRVTLKNHTALSAMADSKANIMLSINAIIISIVVPTMIPKFDANPHLILPTIILVTVCITTIVFATISTRPKITQGTFTKDDIEKKRTNLLFFGNFFNVPLQDFEWGFKEMMEDRDYLYGSMTRDFYFLGQVLGKKYKYLRICYNVFMYGLIFAVLSFIVAYVIWQA